MLALNTENSFCFTNMFELKQMSLVIYYVAIIGIIIF